MRLLDRHRVQTLHGGDATLLNLKDINIPGIQDVFPSSSLLQFLEGDHVLLKDGTLHEA